MSTTGNALLANRKNNRIGTAILCREMRVVHGNRGFGSIGAIETRGDILWHDLGSIGLGHDVSFTIHGRVAFGDVVARVIVVERSHPIHEDSGLNGVLQLIISLYLIISASV